MTNPADFGQTPITEWFDETVAARGHLEATYYMGQSRSYADLGEKVERVAKGLQDMGIGQGDRVGLVLPNAPQFIIYYYAILKLGAVVVNFNPLYTEHELTGLIETCKPKALVTFNLTAFAQKVGKVADASPHVQALILIPFQRALPKLKAFLFTLLKRKDWVKTLPTPKLVAHEKIMEASGKASYPRVNADDLAILQFTGGTTGLPKAAMLSHRNIAANVEQAVQWLPELPEGSGHMAVLPFFHIFAMTCVMNFSVKKGMRMVMMPRFELDGFLKLVQSQKPNVLCTVPTIMQAVLNYPKARNFDLSSLDYGISGGAPLPVEVKREFEAFSKATVVEGYGLSETSPVVCSNPFAGENKAGSVGQAWPGVEVSIRDIDNPSKIMAQGESGELCFKGPNVFTGYYENPSATEKTFTDGYFRTGDVGYLDDDGYIFINDRIKDMIIASGYNVYPRKIEDAFYKHEAVAEALVIGVKDEYRGEAPVAYINFKPGQDVDLAEMEIFLRTYLSKIEMPEQINIRPNLPKTLIGKPSRKDLRIELEKEAEAA